MPNILAQSIWTQTLRTASFCALFVINGAQAHHSDAGMDLNSIYAFEAEVIRFSWRQPHAYIIVETEESGEPVQWEIEMGALNVLARRAGWNKDSLTPGDQVFIRSHVMRSGRKYAKLESITMASGEPVTSPENIETTESKTDSLSGIWIGDRTMFGQYPGGFDGFFNAFLKLTEKGQRAKDSFDPLSSENPESTCVGRPTPAALVSTWIYLMEIDMSEAAEVIRFRSEWFDEHRDIYMDGRDHPDPGQRFTTGHSIGHWEGDTLIVDTRNFEDHRSPYQVGVPSGGQKHVIEKYRLVEDGTLIAMEFILEDPEYLSEPMIHSRNLIYSPHLKMYSGGCDPESTKRFLEPPT
ncbi:MAG: DUF6152 family protein [Arenicellaceae bacterium]|nr:DUF6152 family protein [Arenicellaceae bacterium]